VIHRIQALWPRRLANQLACLLVLALLVSNGMALLVLQRTGALIHPLSRSLSVEQVANAYLMALQAQGEVGAQASEALRGGPVRTWLAAQADVAPHAMRHEEQQLSVALAARLVPPPPHPARVQLERASGAMARSMAWLPTRQNRLHLRTSIPLPDGRYLNVLQYPTVAYAWSDLLAYALPVSSIPLLLVVLFFVRRVVHPVKQLADATERLSRGVWAAPLPLSGPKEARDLTRAFNLMQERIGRHVESRTRMFAALSHDLNTPITEVRLQLELVDDVALRNDLRDSVVELQAMVKETLDFIRDDVQQEGSALTSLSGILEDLARRYTTLGKPVTWQIVDGVHCQCRPLALKRALTNLIDNALRHAGDAVVQLHRQADGQTRIEILDHGSGIDPDLLEQVFDRPSRSTEREGLGLGLTLARSCIRAHGGELTLENRPPAGMCAVIVLPANVST